MKGIDGLRRLFVPIPMTTTMRFLGWARIRRFYRWERSLPVRRALVLGWAALMMFYARLTLFVGRESAALGLEMTMFWLVMVLWAFRTMRLRLAQPTLEDRAALEYGLEFDSLSERQRGEVVHRQTREIFLGDVGRDEREAELWMRAQGTAYRLLRFGLPAAVAGYWAICVWRPSDQVHRPVTVAIVFTWTVVVVLVLPTMVRMWTQPDEVGEPKLVAMGREA